MGVDETRRDRLPGGIDDAHGPPQRLDLRARANPHNDNVAHGDHRIINNARLRNEIENPTTGDQQIARRSLGR